MGDERDGDEAPTRPDHDVADPAGVRAGRSVFDDPESLPAGEAEPRADVTSTYEVVDADIAPGASRDQVPASRRVLDGAAFGVYEDDRPRSRVPVVIGALLVLAVVVVGVLVWRAVNTDADLAVPEDDPAPTTSAPGTPAPTVDAALALVSPRVASCQAPPAQPDDAPARVVLQCPLDGVPEALAYVLYATIADRDAAFDSFIDELALPDSDTECALGQHGSHDYIGVERVGRVACKASGGRVDFLWTTDEAPMLVRSGGGGPFARHYRFWADLVDRTDGAFPLAPEQALLDRLPDELRNACERDLGLNVDAPGVAAAKCNPADDAVDVMSSVQFGDIDTMTSWIDGRRDSLRDNVFAETDDACTPDGFGRRPVAPTSPTTSPTPTTTADGDPAAGGDAEGEPPPPAPDAGFHPYEIGSSTGEVLCFVNSSGLNAIFWIRDDSRIGSIAVSNRETGATMAGLLAWWEAGGHRP